MKQRIAFREMYSNISEDWGLDKDKVNDIITMYTDQLVREILDDTPLTINRYFRDIRTDEEYYYDLLLGRIAEDFIVIWLEKYNYTVEKIGNDKDGIIHRTPQGRITNCPDLRVGGKEVEIQISSEGRRQTYDIKQNKGKKILYNNTILLFVIGNEYLIVDKETISRAELKVNHAWGGKVTYNVVPEEKDYRSMKDNIDWLE